MRKLFEENKVFAMIITGLVVVGFFTVCVLNPEIILKMLMLAALVILLPFIL